MEEELFEEEPLEEDFYFSEDNGMAIGYDDGYQVDSMEDIGRIELWNVGDDEVDRFHFGDLEITFEFYNTFAKVRGFSARKSKTRKNNGEVVKLNFVCFREGYRLQKFYSMKNKKREPRAETRCGCNASIQVHFVPATGSGMLHYFQMSTITIILSLIFLECCQRIEK